MLLILLSLAFVIILKGFPTSKHHQTKPGNACLNKTAKLDKDD